MFENEKVYVIFGDQHESVCWGVFSDRDKAFNEAQKVESDYVWVEERRMDELDSKWRFCYMIKG